MNLNLEELAWSVAEGKTKDYTFRNRFRHFPSTLETKSFPIRLNIFWNLKDEDIDGNPTKEDLEKVHIFENRIVEAVEVDEFSILSMVLTGNGQREFVFHTSDPNEFLQRLTNMLQEEERYPIEIHSNEDENWSYYYDEVGHFLNEDGEA